jgi:hypothetical protein
MLFSKTRIGLTIFYAAIAAIMLDLFLGWRGYLCLRAEPFFIACAF